MASWVERVRGKRIRSYKKGYVMSGSYNWGLFTSVVILSICVASFCNIKNHVP